MSPPGGFGVRIVFHRSHRGANCGRAHHQPVSRGRCGAARHRAGQQLRRGRATAGGRGQEWLASQPWTFSIRPVFLPTNAVISSASFTLTVVQNGTATANYDLDRLLVDWSESDVTWNTRIAPATAWTAGGGQSGTDFAASPSATTSFGSAGSTTTFASAGLLADVQQWANHPDLNFGWMLLASGEFSSTGKIVGSRENPGNEPVLVIDYALAAPPIPPLISGVTSAANQFGFSFNAESNRTYAVEFCGDLPGSSWNVLTNIAATPNAATVNVSDPLTTSNRFYRVRTP